MKKKDLKLEKLKLNRETLRNLTESDLRGAVGGATLQNSCDTVTFRCGTMQSNCC
ncbi:MAG TPA: class I lanthipeptide [Thermoanaerobaculia bacterium]|jgi:hypothetical protein|nr:class I lanthipeptide [Thermoanaerobaculia bacterium]